MMTKEKWIDQQTAEGLKRISETPVDRAVAAAEKIVDGIDALQKACNEDTEKLTQDGRYWMEDMAALLFCLLDYRDQLRTFIEEVER